MKCLCINKAMLTCKILDIHIRYLNLKVMWQEHCVCYRATWRGLHGWLKIKTDFFNIALNNLAC